MTWLWLYLGGICGALSLFGGGTIFVWANRPDVDLKADLRVALLTGVMLLWPLFPIYAAVVVGWNLAGTRGRLLGDDRG